MIQIVHPNKHTKWGFHNMQMPIRILFANVIQKSHRKHIFVMSRASIFDTRKFALFQTTYKETPMQIYTAQILNKFTIVDKIYTPGSLRSSNLWPAKKYVFTVFLYFCRLLVRYVYLNLQNIIILLCILTFFCK